MWPSRKTLRYGLLLAVSVAALSGCVSAVTTDMRADNTGAQESEDTVATAGDAADAATAAADGAEATADAANADTGQQSAGADMAGLVMQPASLDAGKASIYSNGGVAPTGTADMAQTNGMNASAGSLYASAGAAGAEKTGRLPVEDMPPVDATGQQQQVLAAMDGEDGLPANVPIPTTARTALVEENAGGNAAGLALASRQDDGTAAGGARKDATQGSLFAGTAEAAGDAVGVTQKPRRVLNRDAAGAMQVASLGVLPGVSNANPLFSDDHSEADEVDDDTPEFKEVASLAGLARLAPNGLWLQTEKVKTGCFKPELLQVLKTVENHYGKPIIVTSGLRSIKPGRAKQSLHTRCEAADIQISGVTKWELAEYLRSMPGRGGVGTYCHTESVHIDVGTQRDWNWRCRRKK